VFSRIRSNLWVIDSFITVVINTHLFNSCHVKGILVVICYSKQKD
jgi:hypothetical protein